MSSKKCFFAKIDSIKRFEDKSINRIKIATVDSNQCIVGIDTPEGQTGILFYPDAVLSTDFMISEGLPEKAFNKGRVRVSRFKKEWSEALFLPKTKYEVDKLFNGDFNVGDFLPEGEVYKNYILPISKTSVNKENSLNLKISCKSYKSFPRHFDTEQLRSSIPEIKALYQEGWNASISQKVHGTCLTGKMKVKMADGKSKKIKHIKIGDLVCSSTGSTLVTDVFSYPNLNNWVKLIVLGDDGKRIHTLVCTLDHLILCEGGYRSAKSLSKNDLVYLQDFKIGTVVSVSEYDISLKKDKRRYDITTESSNFIAEGIIVHNSARSGYVRIPVKANPVEEITENCLFFLYRAFKYFKFKDITKKIDHLYKEYSLKIKKKYIDTISDNYDYVNGTRNVILDNYSKNTNSGYHDFNFRDSAFNIFKKYLEKDVVVFYEIIGYEDKNKPIMIPNNGIDYSYGIENGDFGIQVYRISIGGKDLSVEDMEAYSTNKLGVSHVFRMTKIFNIKDYSFDFLIDVIRNSFDESACISSVFLKKDFSIQKTNPYSHINEGIVLRMDSPDDNIPPKFFKLKRPEFYEAEGLIKASEAAKSSIEQE